jgi:hypothetical protein
MKISSIILEKVSRKIRIKNLIREQVEILELEDTSEVEAIEDVWSGDIEGKDSYLVLPLDHSKVAKSEPVTKHAESLPDATPVPVLNNEGHIQVYRGQNDLGRSHRLPGIIYERYYDAYVSGHTDTASVILEEHLDTRFPGWLDYEWKS